MLDLIGQACFNGALIASPLVLGLAVRLLRRRRMGIRWGAALSFAVATAVSLLWIGTAIALRDGLAPGMVVSEGTRAVGRALPGILMGAMVGTLIASVGIALLWNDPSQSAAA